MHFPRRQPHQNSKRNLWCIGEKVPLPRNTYLLHWSITSACFPAIVTIFVGALVMGLEVDKCMRGWIGWWMERGRNRLLVDDMGLRDSLREVDCQASSVAALGSQLLKRRYVLSHFHASTTNPNRAYRFCWEKYIKILLRKLYKGRWVQPPAQN